MRALDNWQIPTTVLDRPVDGLRLRPGPFGAQLADGGGRHPGVTLVSFLRHLG